jgi:hypothetical protein
MSEHGTTGNEPKITEKPRIEEHLVYALLALPIFAVSIFIIVLIATLGTKNP